MIEATTFTPLAAAIGGALIGVSATLLMLTLGKIAGISGLFRMAFSTSDPDRGWKLAFFAGMIIAAFLVFSYTPAAFEPRQGFPVWQLVVAGLLVGFGTAMGSGCTSGHGVCGLARLSSRSLVSTVVFMVFGIATAILVRHVIGGGV